MRYFQIMLVLLCSAGFMPAAMVVDPDCIQQCEDTWEPVIEFWRKQKAAVEVKLVAAELAVTQAQAAIDTENDTHSENMLVATEALVAAAAACAALIAPPLIAGCEEAAGTAFLLASIHENNRHGRELDKATEAYNAAVLARFALQTQLEGADNNLTAALNSEAECVYACPFVER